MPHRIVCFYFVLFTFGRLKSMINITVPFYSVPFYSVLCENQSEIDSIIYSLLL